MIQFFTLQNIACSRQNIENHLFLDLEAACHNISIQTLKLKSIEVFSFILSTLLLKKVERSQTIRADIKAYSSRNAFLNIQYSPGLLETSFLEYKFTQCIFSAQLVSH